MTVDSASDRASEYVQLIVLLVDRIAPAAELDGVTAVAVASVDAFRRDVVAGADLSVWDAWLDGPFAKSVRRADRKMFDRVCAEFLGEVTVVRVGDAEAAAFRPVPAGLTPRTLSRLQVSGTSLPSGLGVAPAAGGPTVVLNIDLAMTTGKAAAQAAHALFAFSLVRGFPLGTPTVRFEPRAVIDALLAVHLSAVRVEDAGRTEIEPGSLTAIAF